MNLRGHFGLHATSSVISGPFLPVGPSEALAGAQGFVASLQAGIMSLPVPGISSWRYDGIGPASCDGGMAPPGVINAVGGDTADPLMHRDLRQQVGQNTSPVRSNRWRFTGSTSPMRLLVISTARTSSVSASTPM